LGVEIDANNVIPAYALVTLDIHKIRIHGGLTFAMLAPLFNGRMKLLVKDIIVSSAEEDIVLNLAELVIFFEGHDCSHLIYTLNSDKISMI